MQFVSSGGTNPDIGMFSTTATVLQSVVKQSADRCRFKPVKQASATVASNSTVAGAISGSGGIAKTGTGYAYITGVNNSFGGPVNSQCGSF